ncbi:hypothetical protein V6N13_017258 [Hibiscus sabdariffa]|uniref:Uncharacterized protein n=1 Tax=Hibiscus sabdariffa TaxID=183260 RepID=A0ABR2CZF1_9ROSI
MFRTSSKALEESRTRPTVGLVALEPLNGSGSLASCALEDTTSAQLLLELLNSAVALHTKPEGCSFFFSPCKES